MAVLLPATAFALKKPRPEDRVLANFDSRWLSPRPTSTPPEVESALEGLRRQSPFTLDARFHPLTRALRLLSARGGALTPPSADGPEDVARGFLRANRELFALSEADLANLVRTREYESRGDRIRHVLFQQVVEGIPVFGGIVGVHVDEEGRVVFVSNNGVPDPEARPGARRSATSPRLRAEEAIRAALADIRPELEIEPLAVSAATGRDRRATFGRGPLRRNIPAQLVYFPVQPRPRLAWRMVLEPVGFPQSYDILVDAESGDVLYRRNRVLYADGVGNVVQSAATAAQDPRRPDEHPLGSGPAGPGDLTTGCPPIDGYESRDLTAPFRDPATVLNNTGRLSGNNTRAYRTFVGSFGALGTADPEGRWHFEFPFNSASSAETNLFFASNYLHDFFYDLGFDEAAGNFQVNNFGRGGVGGDPLNALARADGRNNATFEPQPEGVSPTMSMFLFDASGCWTEDVDGDGFPDLDGDYDADIVIHEYHHGVSHRLNTDFTGDEADAIGEGGSDFFAYSITGNTKLAEYAVPPDGIRRVNAKTYADWFCFDFFFFFICEPHDNGEIWANTLWDMREQFRIDVVEGSEAAAINEVHQLYVDGLKLSPASPTMLDMRDAMLQADLLRNPSGEIGGSDNYCRMWLIFAGRGMGLLAQDTHDTGDGTVVADFSVPAICPAPPPKPVVTVTASDATAAEAGLETGAFTFSRTGSTDAALVVSYAVGGTATAGSDYIALAGTVTIPVGAADATVILTPVDDTLVEIDETVEVELEASITYVMGAPASAAVVISSEDILPDLVASVTVEPFIAGPGISVTVMDTTTNQGTDASAASLTRFYLSQDGTIDATDVVLGSRAVPALAIGASSSGSTTVSIPAATATGLYVVIADADGDQTIDEIDETNNVGAAVIQVGPDLAITAFTGPATGGAGSAVTLNDTTRNQGGGGVPASITRFYLSQNTVLDAADALLGSRSVPALAAGASSSGSSTVTIPAGTSAGPHYFIAMADGDQAIAETYEANNSLIALVWIGPDLTVAALTAPPAAEAGAAISVSDTTRNTGGGDAGASVTRFYLSINAALDAGDTLIGGRAVPALGSGASSVVSTTLTIPAGTASGLYYLLAQADGEAAVPETFESNNTQYAAIQVGSDLVLTAFTGPASAGAGSVLTLTDTTRNQGGGGVAASVTRFYLSQNTALDAADTLLGSRPVPALAAGASSSGSATVTVPAGTPSSPYYLIAQADGEQAIPETSEANNTLIALVWIGPDLTMAALTVPTAAGAGAEISVSDTTRNLGGGSAGASVTRFYLSANTAVDAGDTLLGGRSVPALGPGVSSSGSTTLTIPAATAAGTYYVVAQADGGGDVAETLEGNNSYYGYVLVGPDLVVSALTAPPSSGPGLSMTVNDTTRNLGGGTTPVSTTRFYLSTNLALDAADTLIGGRPVPALGAGASSSVSTSLTIPAGTPAGGYYLIAQADGDQAVSETQEINNTALVFLWIGPDLNVSSVTAPATADAGTPISVSDTTRNVGGGGADATLTRLYLSTNTVVDAGDTLLGGRSVPALAAAASSAGSTTVTIPAGTTAGPYYVIAHADGDQAISETQETNNTAAAFLWIGPDLIVAAFTAPATGGAGLTLTLSDTTRNQGGGSVAASTTRFYVSSNTILDASDSLAGSRSVPALAPGASSSVSTALTIPAGTASGWYYLIAQADGDQLVAETQETNNTAYVLISIGPDLTIAAMTAPPAAAAGAAISVSDTTRNAGGGNAGASLTRFYLSINTAVDAGDTLVGSRSVPALAPGASSAVSTALTIPAGTASGSYYLIAQADGDGVVAETSEINNTMSAAILIGSDLVIAAFTAPAMGGAELALTLSDTTRNQGGGAVAASTTRFYLSSNTTLDASDALAGSRPVPALAPGVSSSVSTAVTIPAGTASGPYYLIAQADGEQLISETNETNNIALAFLWIGPDLTIVSVTAPPAAAAGAAISVSDTTRNVGGGSAGASVTRFHLSVNTALDAGDTLLGSRPAPALAPATSSIVSTTLTIPAGTASGPYYLIAQADGEGALPETFETNNTSSALILIGSDMVISAFTAPSMGGAGLSLTLSDTTRNQGGGGVPASVTRFYLSQNTVLDAADALLGSRPVPALAPGASSSVSTAVTIPAGSPSGPRYLIAQADGEQLISETNETNNIALALLWIGPDLTIASVTAPPTAAAGAAISVSDTTRNAGGGTAGATLTRLYLSTNAVVDAGDTLLGSRSAPELGTGASSVVSTTLTIPAGTSSGLYYLIAQADGEGAVAESFESNNTSYTWLQIGPDLIMSSFTAPPSSGAGLSITVSDTTRNQGAGVTPASATRFYLSANTVLDGSDTLLGSRAVPGLAAATSDTASTALTIPAGTSSGPHYVIAQADGEQVVSETQEANNTALALVWIGPDLYVFSMTAPASAAAGSSITLADTLKNQGGGAAPATTTRFYLSTNTTLDGGDVVLGVRSALAMAAGGQDSGTSLFTIPAGTAPGYYYLLAKADADNAVPETFETNNVTSRLLQVTP